MPRRPARPAICWNSFGINMRRRRPSHLLMRPINGARRHVDAQSRVSVAKTTSIRPRVKSTSTSCLISGTPRTGSEFAPCCSRAWRNSSPVSAFGDLEDQIIALGEEIDRIPQGCLIGLEGGEELLEDYRVNRSLAAAQSKERRLEGERSTG